MTAYPTVPAGAPDQSSGGEVAAPSQVYSTGKLPPSTKVGLFTVRVDDLAASDDVGAVASGGAAVSEWSAKAEGVDVTADEAVGSGEHPVRTSKVARAPSRWVGTFADGIKAGEHARPVPKPLRQYRGP